MMAMTLPILITTLLCILSTTSCGRVIVGAKTEITDVTTNKEVQEIGRFAVEEYNYKQGLSNSGGGEALKFVEVVEAEKQVVSGMKYYLNISAVDHKGVHRMFTSVVVVKPWLQYKKLLHFGPSSTFHQMQHTTM
ncbi:cysteine proteinase inhibitor B-like [Trifolium pratense]|uniref:cysteine proteinase inhibitor B-like n=1 Tax=Trifolium pratense TaxID=57577 RepID=UPI001E690863|nr:cysteine proteinase inhibitor B-like [Trifolium pratense]